MRTSLTLLIAFGLIISPEVAGAFPVAKPAVADAPPAKGAIVPVEYRRTTVHRHTTVRRPVEGGTTVRRSTTVRRTTVVAPVRPWVRRPYYGTVVAGVALGTVVAVAATAAPAPPSPNLCWYWTNSSQTKGYWDYCR